MKFAIISDIHISNHNQFGGDYINGLNDRCKAIINAIDAAYDSVQLNGYNKVFILGDLFHYSTPSPVLLGAFLKVLASKKEVETHILYGNHDASSTTEKEWFGSLYPLSFIGDPKITIYDNERKIEKLRSEEGIWAQSFVRGQKPNNLIKLVTENDKVILGHYEITGRNGVFKEEALSFSNAYTSNKHIYSGDFHHHAVYSDIPKSIIQVGALVPTGFDNPGLDYGKILLVDSEKGTEKIIQVNGPRFHIIHEKEEDQRYEISNFIDSLPNACDHHFQITGCRLWVDLVKGLLADAGFHKVASRIPSAAVDFIFMQKESISLGENLVKYAKSYAESNNLDDARLVMQALRIYEKGKSL